MGRSLRQRDNGTTVLTISEEILLLVLDYDTDR